MAELSTRAPDPDPERLPSPAWFKDQVAGADDALAEWAKDPTDRESSNTDKPKAAVNGGGHKPAVNSDRDRASTGSSEPAEAPRPAPRSGAAATDPGAPPSPRRGEQRPPDADPATGPGGDVDEPMHGPEPGKQTNKQTSEAPKSVDSTRNSARRTPMPRSLDRLFLTFYAVTLGLALWGQTLGLARILYGNQRVAELAAAPFLQRTAFFSLPLAFAFVIELLAALLLHWADWRRMTRLETSYVAYAFATLVAAAVAFLNWYGHLGGITGGLFAGASLTAFGMWVLRSYGRLKDALAERAALPDLPEDIPDPVARRARELSRRKPGESVWAYIETARTQLANEERHAAIRDALAARIGAAGCDPRLALAVYDPTLLATHLAGKADYKLLADMLNDELAPTQLIDPKPSPARRRRSNTERSNKSTTERSRGSNTERSNKSTTERSRESKTERSERSNTEQSRRSNTEHPNEKRDKVLRAAAKLGPNPSVRAVAAAAGVSVSTAHAYMPNRKEQP